MLPIARTAEITATVERLFIARTRDEGRRGAIRAGEWGHFSSLPEDGNP